ncbi:MAG TPA: DUF1028 domain-containing protein [Streptosporangiaceae bacterium]|jgi:uncharacterized Ntn-hydrolase superfamily protein|nr:DUF1028 domain-containing protein [Streptosporangiaceae bacterium]
MTFSVLARDERTGALGVASQSKFLAIGAVVPSAAADTGAIATQALANGSFGPRGLRLLAGGSSATETLSALLAEDERSDRRQVGIIDSTGMGAAHTGGGCTGWAGHLVGDGFVCVGNMLAGQGVLQAMADSLATTSAEPNLGVRLVTALQQAADAGGDARGQQSAAVVVVQHEGGYGGHTDRWIDLRVDDHPQPISELRRLLSLHRLYFERPDPDSLLELNGDLADEVANALNRLDPLIGASDNLQALWQSLDGWAGRENLEERMILPGWIDPVVLSMLRERSIAAQ